MRLRMIAEHEVGALGLSMGDPGASGRVGESTIINAVHDALRIGATFLNAAHPNATSEDARIRNEVLLARALDRFDGDASQAFIGTAAQLDADASADTARAAEHLAASARASAGRLGVEAIGILQLRLPEDHEAAVTALTAAQHVYDAGIARHIGLIDARAEQIRLARRVLSHALVSVHNEFSPARRASAPELQLCIELDLAFVPFNPLAGFVRADRVSSRYEKFTEVAAELGLTVQQVVLAWEFHLSHLIVPCPNVGSPSHLRAWAHASELELTPETISYLSAP